MTYSKFINSVSSDFYEYIKESMKDFFDFCYGNCESNRSNGLIKNMSVFDKIVLSLFLEYIKNNKENIKKANIDEEDIFEIIGLKEYPKNNPNKDYDFENIFSTFFSNVITEVLKKLGICISDSIIYNISPEDMLYYISNPNLCRNNLINEIFELYERADFKVYLYSINSCLNEHREKYNNSEALAKTYNGDISNLTNYGKVLNDKEFIVNPSVSREEEIEELMIDLNTTDMSAILVGDAGVGKTAIVDGLAYKIQNGNVPKRFRNKKIINITTSDLIAGCKYVGEVEETMKKFLEEAKKAKDVIFFIDEIHTIIGAGKGDKGVNGVSDILKPAIADGSITIIGATTKDEYEEYITRDPAFKNRFDKIDIDEPKGDKLKNIIRNEIKRMELIYDIDFGIEGYSNETIINSLIEITSKKHRRFDEEVYNPRLVLSILRKAYSIADLDERDYLIIDDIRKSICMNNFLNESARKREAFKLNEEKNKGKVLTFPKRF